METPEDFWLKLKADDSNCWIWTMARGRRGYGVLNYQGKWWRAHRLAWTLAKGPIPEQQLVCHKCDNPPCCNPSHLFIGDKLANVRDAVAKGRVVHGEAYYRSRLSEEQVREVKRLYAEEHMRPTGIASTLGLSHRLVWSAIKAWKYLHNNNPLQEEHTWTLVH